MRRAAFAALAVVLAVTACAGEDPNVTDSGKGKPVVTVEFPSETAPGTQHEAVLKIHNPGPGEMRSLVVAFAAVGPLSGQREIPTSIVAFGIDGENPSVLATNPEASAVSEDGVLFTFGPLCPGGGSFPGDCQDVSRDEAEPRLAEGDTITITFTLKVPVVSGVAANSVQVYDGSEPARAGGARLETLVGR
ncbi:MAG: hypothetical protein ACLGHL_03170 [Actinomycetota bacterium]